MPEEPFGRERVFDIPEEEVPIQRTPPRPAPIREAQHSAPASVPKRPSPQPTSAPAPEETAAAGADTAAWVRLLDQYKGRLAVNHRVFLNMAGGVLEDDCLTVYCDNDFVRTSLDHPSVISVLQEVTSQYAGHPIRVVMTVGKRPQANAGGAPRRAPAPQPKAKPQTPPPAPAAPVAAPQPKAEPAAPPPSTAPEATPPWESAPPASHDKLDKIVDAAPMLDHFKIK